MNLICAAQPAYAFEYIAGVQVQWRRISQNGFTCGVCLYDQTSGVEQHHSAGQIGKHGLADVLRLGGLLARRLPQALKLCFLFLKPLNHSLIRGEREGGITRVDGTESLCRAGSQRLSQAPHQPYAAYKQQRSTHQHYGHFDQHRIGEPVHRYKPPYQRMKASPKNSATTAMLARYEPNGLC